MNLANKSKTFCVLPWIHLYANPDGSVLPCCIGDHNNPLGNIQNNTIKEIWSNDAFKSLRHRMLTGKRSPECSACYHSEDNGVNSFRQTVNRDYADVIPNINDNNPEMDLKYLDIRWSNICNFKCRSCSSTYSSSWAQEDGKKDIVIFAGGEDNDALYEQILPYVGNLREIYFAGGEPLLMEKHYDLLDHLVETGNTKLKLRYNTNLSSLKYKSKSITDYWNNFSNVVAYASIDSWGDRAEYIREGTKWNEIEKNINTIRKQSPHVKLEMSTVVSAFNAATLIPFLDHVVSLFDQNFNPSFYCLINPSYYSFSILPDELKNNIIKKLSNVRYSKSINNQLNNVINQLSNAKHDPLQLAKFIRQTAHYDQLRKKDFVSVFPELVSLLPDSSKLHL
jgi:radical SAM protein with 4Fe4S-binding SPASM domain